MFSWICPQCGHDVPPSKTECPYCAERAQQAAAAGYPPQPQPPAQAVPPQPYAPVPQAPPTWQPPAPPPPPPPPAPPVQAYPPPPQPYPPQPYPPQYAAPPQPYPPQPPAAQQTMTWPPPQKKAPPSWMVGGGVALALLLVFGGIYYFMSRGDTTSASAAPRTAAASPDGKTAANPLQKSIEVTGLRFTTENQKPMVRFVVVNHSSVPISDLSGTVNLLAGTSRSDEDQIGSFNLNVDVLEANGSREMSAPLKTKLKAYEMPDWQNASAEVQITSPAP
ncbi:MAG TPA: hypothetical protein VEF06_09250 [Bryobacteraceae bacterium]|nr:hypothetical protein [Bryobacteraceae bacterium]